MLLLKGSIGKPGAGACPVRGHSNVQGDRTVGIFDRPSKELLDSLQKEFGFNPPRKDGYDVVKSVEAMHAGKAKVFLVWVAILVWPPQTPNIPQMRCANVI